MFTVPFQRNTLEHCHIAVLPVCLILIIFDFRVRIFIHFFQTIKWFMGHDLSNSCQFGWSDELMKERTEASRI